MRMVAVVLVVLALAGCGGLQSAVQGLVLDLAKVTAEDAKLASSLAAAAKDPEAPYRKECYDAVAEWAATLQAPAARPTPKGVLSAFELAAEADRSLRAGGDLLPQAVRAKCAILIVSTQEFLGRVGLRIGGSVIPGAGLLSR